jgi:hypothetical protein
MSCEGVGVIFFSGPKKHILDKKIFRINKYIYIYYIKRIGKKEEGRREGRK